MGPLQTGLCILFYLFIFFLEGGSGVILYMYFRVFS